MAQSMWSEPKYLSGYLSVALCAAAFLLLLVFRKKQTNASSLSQDTLPGPRKYFLGNYLNLLELADQRKIVKVITNWCREHRDSPIMKVDFGPLSMVVLQSPSYIQKLLGSIESDHLGKYARLYASLKPVSWFDGLLHSKVEKWKSRRKAINPMFSYHSVLDNVSVMNEYGRRLVGQLEAHFGHSSSSSAPPRPIYSILFDTTLALLLKTTFGVDVSDHSDTHQGYDIKGMVEGTKRLFQIAVARVLHPWLGFDSIFQLHPMSKDLHHFYDLSSDFILKLIRENETESHQGKSLLKDLMGSGLPVRGIYEETMTIIMGGHDTTGSALHSLFFFLALHPEIQGKCQREVDSVFESEDLCFGGGISAKSLRKLGYLEQCVMEAMRLCPPALIYARELAGKLVLGDDLELPPGTKVGVWVPGVHMNPELYPNPKTFDPDRFSPAMRNNRHPYSFIPFSAGPRRCIGYKYAIMELLILTAHVIRHFTLSTTDKFEDILWLLNVTLTPEKPMKFMLESRSHVADTTEACR